MVEKVTLFAVFVLAGCAPLQPVTTAVSHQPPKAEFCAEAFPIIVSPLDSLTKDTAHQIVAHDDKGAKLCGWKRLR
jgi:hypothetical protein